MSGYEVKVYEDKLKPMSEIGNRELSTWRGVKNKSLRGRHITDGAMLIDKKHVEGEDLFEKLTKRKSDETVENDRIKALVSDLKEEKQWVGKVRGQTTTIGGMMVQAKWIAVVGYRNYKRHCLADAMRIKMMEKLFDGTAEMKVGDSEILTWWKYGVPVGAVATYNHYKPNVQ